jgi:hypothetical protein
MYKKSKTVPKERLDDNEIFDFSHQAFADFFIPKSSAMYNEIFDIEIENVR